MANVDLLNQNDVERFAADGYLAGVPVLSPEETERYGAALMELYDSVDESRHRFFINIHASLAWADELIRHPRILDAVRPLLGDDLFLWKSKGFVKLPGVATVPWHQDLYTWNLDPMPETVTAWVALSDVTEANGCVEVAPGTHVGGLRPAQETNDTKGLSARGISVELTPEEEAQARPMLLEAGEISLHSGLVVHSSGPNTTDAPRMGIALVYMPAHVTQTSEPDRDVVLVSGEDKTGGFFPVDPRPSGTHEEQMAAAHRYVDRLRSGEIMYAVR